MFGWLCLTLCWICGCPDSGASAQCFALRRRGGGQPGVEVERRNGCCWEHLCSQPQPWRERPIGFVGLIVPHVRMLVGPDHRLLLPASALGGYLSGGGRHLARTVISHGTSGGAIMSWAERRFCLATAAPATVVMKKAGDDGGASIA